MILPGILASGISGHLGGNFTSLQTVTVGSGGASAINFSSIPSTYTHLQIRAFATISGQRFGVNFNGDNGSTYTNHFIYGGGSGAVAGASVSTVGANTIGFTSTGTYYNATICDILDYSNPNKYKTWKSLNGYDANGSGYIFMHSGLWSNTSAITSISLQASEGTSGSFSQYSTFALYGVK